MARTFSRWTSVTALLLLLMAGSGCHSGATRQESRHCQPRPGMTTAQLSACGCFSASGSTQYAGGLDADETDEVGVRGISILSYLCPTGGGRIARVLVLNGIAKDVYE